MKSAEIKLETVKLLLQYNADINALDDNKITPLYLATYHVEEEIVKTLLINGANPNLQESEELITPIYYALPEIMKLLFDYAIDLDLSKRNFDGNTAFEDAMMQDEFAFVKNIKMFVYHQHIQ